jgi:hyperosmotically inducible periplasmic protein
MKQVSAFATKTLIGVAIIALTGCASSSMTSKSTQETDEGITSVVQQALETDEKVKARQVEVETREGVVYLTGVVDTEESRREAARVSWRTEGVRGVRNGLTVGERTVGEWVDDVMISSKVKSQLIANPGIEASDIDVGSSKGVVTLIGRVSTQRIKTDAEDIARATKGVSDVHNELQVGKSGR